MAAAFGAHATAATFEELAAAGDGWDLVVDASGNAEAIALGLGRLRRGGRFCVFGVTSTSARVEFSPFDVFSRELSIIGTTSVRNSFRRAADLLATKSLPVDLLVTEPFSLDQSELAFERSRQGVGIKQRVAPGVLARPEKARS